MFFGGRTGGREEGREKGRGSEGRGGRWGSLKRASTFYYVFFSARESSSPWVGSPTRGGARGTRHGTARHERGAQGHSRWVFHRSEPRMRHARVLEAIQRRAETGGPRADPLPAVCGGSAGGPGRMAQWCTVHTSSRSCSVSGYRAFTTGTILALRTTRPLERTLSTPFLFSIIDRRCDANATVSPFHYSRRTGI